MTRANSVFALFYFTAKFRTRQSPTTILYCPFGETAQKVFTTSAKVITVFEGRNGMRIAVASDGLNVSMHSGRCASYMCYTVERGVITECQNLPNPCLPPAATAELLASLGIDLFFANTIDPNIERELEKANIEVVVGMDGSARESVEQFITDMMNGSAAFDDEADLQLSGK